MVVIVNGERREVAATNVEGLLAELDYEGAFFAVAVNREVVRRPAWGSRQLTPGDEVEIVTPRQGG